MSNPFRSGTADDWYSGNEADIWIEYKYRPRLGSVTATKLLSPLQFLWITGRIKEGRNVRIIVGFPIGGIIINSHELDTRIAVPFVEARIMRRKEIAGWIYRFTMGKSDVDV